MTSRLVLWMVACLCWGPAASDGAVAGLSGAMAILELQGAPRDTPDRNPENYPPDDDAENHLVVVDLASGTESSRFGVGRLVTLVGVDSGRRAWISRLHPERGTEFLVCDTLSTNSPRMLGALPFYAVNSKNGRGMFLDRSYACLLDDARVAGVFFHGEKEKVGLPDCPQKLIVATPGRGEIEYESDLEGEFRFARMVRFSASHVVLVGLEGGIQEYRREQGRWSRRDGGKLSEAESLGGGSLADAAGLAGGNILAVSPRGVASLRDAFEPFPRLPLPEGARALSFGLATDGAGLQAVASFSFIQARKVTSDLYFGKGGSWVPTVEAAKEIHAMAVIDAKRVLYSHWCSVHLATYDHGRSATPVYESACRRIWAIRHLPAPVKASHR